MEPGENHAHVLIEMVDEVAEPLSVLFERSRQSSEVAADSKRDKNSSTVKKKDLENYRAVSFTLALGKSMEQILLATQLRHMENNMVNDDSQHDFTKGKS